MSVIQASNIRRRLMTPANAVQDHPLEMRNGWPVLPPRAPVVVSLPVVEKPQITEDQFHQRCLEDFNRSIETDAPIIFQLTIREIIGAVAKYYGISIADLLSTRRKANIVRPRHVAMWLAKTLTTNSMPYIGRRLGGRDHTTVLHGVRKIDCLRQDDQELRDQLSALIAALSPSSPQFPESPQSNV